MVKLNKIIRIILSIASLAVPLLAQQPAAQQGQPIFDVNAKYVQGVGPGYQPTAGAGLILNLAPGTAFCSTAPSFYAGGSITLAATATNYVYLDPTSSCAPNSNTSGLASGQIPLAKVVTGSSSITTVTDLRTWFVSQSSGTVTSSGSPSTNNIAAFTTATNITPAVAANIVSLFSACSGTQYLGADGACHTPPSGGAGFTNWTQDGTTGAVTALPSSGEDTTTLVLTPRLASGGTKNIVEAGPLGSVPQAGCTGIYWAVLWNGNVCMAGNNDTLGASGQALASYLQGYGGSTSTTGFSVRGTDSTNAFSSELYFDPLTSGQLSIESIGHTGAATIADVICTHGNAQCTGGSSTAFQANGVALTSATTVNFQNGGPITLTNPSAGNVQFNCATCLINNPTTNQVISWTGTGVTGIGINAPSGQTADPWYVKWNGFTIAEVKWNSGASGEFITHGVSVGDDIEANNSITVDANQDGHPLIFGSLLDRIQHLAAGNSDISGQVVITTATSASVTFPTAYIATPLCVLTPTSNPGSLTWWVATSTTAVTANLSASGSITFNYVCMGNPY